MTEETHDRLDRLESLVARQQRIIEDQTETIEEYRETVETLEAGNDLGSSSVDRRSVLKAGGALGALGLGVGTVSADPTGQVGTASRPIETLYVDGLSGPLTGGTRLDSLVGSGLAVENGELVNSSSLDFETPTIAIDPVDVGDTYFDRTIDVSVTVRETANFPAVGVTVSLTVTDASGTIRYEQSIDVGDLRAAETTVTFGAGGSAPALGEFDTGDYTLTVTAEAANAPSTTVTDAFDVKEYFAGGSGTVDDPFLIDDWAGLHRMREHKSADFEVVGDVDTESPGYGVFVTDPDRGFDPVGDEESPFQGTLWGNGHEIAGLVIDRQEDNGIGLFGRIGPDANIDDVHVTDVDVRGDWESGGLVGQVIGGEVRNSTATGTVAGYYRTGGLVGLIGNDGTVTNSSADAFVENTGAGYMGGLVGVNLSGTVVGCHATGEVSLPEDTHGGGLVGRNLGSIHDCYATSTVTAHGYAGGLVSENGSGGKVADSYALGDASASQNIAGGLVGNNGGTIRRCFSTGAASAQSDVGGLVGFADGTTEESYWDVPASDVESSPTGAGIGALSDTPPADGMVSYEAPANMTGFDFQNVWATVDAETDSDVSADDYPVLRALDRATQLEVRDDA